MKIIKQVHRSEIEAGKMEKCIKTNRQVYLFVRDLRVKAYFRIILCYNNLYFMNLSYFAVSEIWDAFGHMSSEAFELKYNFEKPDQSTRVGLNCLKGIRAFAASDKLLLLGYENVSVYKVNIGSTFWKFRFDFQHTFKKQIFIKA